MIVKKANCNICSGYCGIKVYLENEKVVKVEGDRDDPVTKGVMCVKGKAIPEIINNVERLKSPLKKNKYGEFEDISWDDAISFIGSKLIENKNAYGGRSLVVHTGQAGVGKEFPQYFKRFALAYGSSNYSSAGSHCHTSKEIAHEMTIGYLPVNNFKDSKCIVLWGYNPQVSCPPSMIYINEAIDNGCEIIVIDPIETKLSKKAKYHLKIRPGTDGALALGFLHIIIRDSLYDKDFVEKYTIGFDDISSMAKNYTPSRVSEITGVSQCLIEKAAKLYGNTIPSSLSVGIAVELQSNGFQSARVMAILQAITGNIDIKGGAIKAQGIGLKDMTLTKQIGEKMVGEDEYPLFVGEGGTAQINVLSDVILEDKPYPIKSVMIIGSNPILTWPNTNKLKKAFEKLDFMVVMDNFMTQTAKMADIVLPGAVVLERDEVYTRAAFGQSIFGVSPRICSMDGTMSEIDFIIKLAKKIGLNEFFPYENERDALLDRLSTIKNIDFQGEKIEIVYDPYREKKFLDKGFETPSGKIELYSEKIKEYGLNPIPEYEEPFESPINTNNEYEVVISTGERRVEYQHSRYRNINKIVAVGENQAIGRLHPSTAKRYSLEDGDRAIVESRRGNIKISVSITDKVVENTILIPHGWNDANANILTDNSNLDRYSGFPGNRGFLGKITKI